MEKNKNILIKECDICGENATSLCFKCIHYFCDSCFKFIHDKKKNASHLKEPLDPYIPIDLKCPEHPINPITVFCLDEKGNFLHIYYIFLTIYRSLLLCLPI